MRILKNYVWKIIRKCGMGPFMLRVHSKSVLLVEGWFKSFAYSSPVDREGQPIPWWTYSAIHFLDGRLGDRMRVLELGAGNSTIWLSARCREIVSLENHHDWAEKIRGRVGNNVDIVEVSDYVDSVSAYDKDDRFDIIVVDGKDRVACAFLGLSLLTEKGVFIIDDAERPELVTAIRKLRDQGFQELPFESMRPQVIHGGKTSILYREENCLGI